MTIRASHVSIGLHQEGSENSNASAWKGVCSFRCYVAKTDKKKCKCKCHGVHHGKGRANPDKIDGLLDKTNQTTLNC